MNPMDPSEIDELLRVTLHGDFPYDTRQRLLATLAAWKPIIELLAEGARATSRDNCCGPATERTVFQHEGFCDSGHHDLRRLVGQMYHLLRRIDDARANLAGGSHLPGDSEQPHPIDCDLDEDCSGHEGWTPPVERPLNVERPEATPKQMAALGVALRRAHPNEDMIGALMKMGVFKDLGDEGVGPLAELLDYFVENY